MTIAEKIRQLMREHDLSYRELSDITGISSSSLQSYGSGRSKKVPLSVIRTLTEKFNVPISYWTDVDVDDYHTTTPKEMLTYLEKAYNDPSDKRSIFMANLIELRDMYEKGLLTDEEFQLGKKFLFEMTK